MSSFAATASCPASKGDIAREFGRARTTYEAASRLQRVMGDAMLEKLEGQPGLNSARVIDLGCGTGWFTRKLAGLEGSGNVTGMDLSPGMIEHASAHSPADVTWMVADAEAIPLADQSCDLIFSNLMIQWCATPARVLQECRRVLRPGGKLMVSTLLDGTLKELDQAWQKADPGQKHINRFETEAAFTHSVLGTLPGAEVETRTLLLPYASPLTLAAELKQLGAGYKHADRRQTATAPGRFRAMCQHYPRAPEGGVMASYEAAWVYWSSPDSNGNTMIHKRVG
ncbi:malonyl-ACP O-methyltransferase BioC [Marinobacter salexigens]|uniref:malonyl-ACP O-methyltransferase BioC n=1 Tax=Marinobacter salexigens TaxID=1925763 RepID=UPI000C29396C|nr:malonyl-ACP O-methyltransferase BioC [Marinobacter salexigens]